MAIALAGSVSIGFGGSVALVLAGAFAVGVAGAGSITHAVTAFAGRQGGVLLMRATLASVVGGALGPLVLATAARSIGWSLGVLAIVPVALAVAVLVPVRSMGDALLGDVSDPGATADAAGAGDQGREPPLGRPYWLAWAFLALSIGVESSFVAWAAQVAVHQAGIALADATALGSLFVLGLVLGRVMLGARALRIAPKRLLAGMVLLGIAGGLLVWVGQAATIAGTGLLLAGLGMAGTWATAAGVAVANAPGSPILAGARINLAAGVAVLVAPFLLGVVASAWGVLVAWGVVLAMLAIALAVLRVVPTGRLAGQGEGVLRHEAAEPRSGP